MNREFLLEAVLGITVGLLLSVVAVYRTANPPSAGVLRRAGMVGLLVYALLGAQVLVRQGMTWIGSCSCSSYSSSQRSRRWPGNRGRWAGRSPTGPVA